MTKANNSGGSATAGGIDFQAAVSAIAAVHMSNGTPLGWLDGLVQDVPTSVYSETGNAGDDIAITLECNSLIEIQVKKGLHDSSRLWSPLIDLAHAIYNKQIAFGLLIVCPNSSKTVRDDLANDLVRFADGRTDGCKNISKKLLTRLEQEKIPFQEVCKKLRIHVVNAVNTDSSAIKAAHSELRHICINPDQVSQAWERLYREAVFVIKRRGKWTTESIYSIFLSAKIEINSEHNANPISIIKRFSNWSQTANNSLTIFGLNKTFTIDECWHPIKTIIYDTKELKYESLDGALDYYHDWEKRKASSDDKEINPVTIARFFKHNVVVAGPGMGKTTLLKKLFRTFTSDGYIALLVSLKDIAARMNNTGSSFEEALFKIGFDGLGLNYCDSTLLNLSECVILCDGLDECGNYQEELCQKLLNFIAGNDKCKVVITTRPIGYTTSLLKDWRHYELLPYGSNDAKDYLSVIISILYADDSQAIKETLAFAASELDKSNCKNIITRSPLLLSLVCVLASQKKGFGNSKVELFKSLFKLIDDTPQTRKIDTNISPSLLVYFINFIGWDLLINPLSLVEETLQRCAYTLAKELEYPKLKAKSLCDECLIYWEQVGIIERVQHYDKDTLTFIHKSFCEFSSGRYITSLTVDEQNILLQPYIFNDLIEESLIFSCSLGSINPIIEQILRNLDIATDDDHKNVESLLKLIVNSELKPDVRLLSSVIERAFTALITPEKGRSFTIASYILSLVDFYPSEINAQAKMLLKHDYPWVRLASWAFLVKGGKNHFNASELIKYVKGDNIKPKSAMGFSLLNGGYLNLAKSDKELLEIISLEYFNQVLTLYSKEVQDKLLEPMLKLSKNFSRNLDSKISKILHNYNRKDLALQLYSESYSSKNFAISNYKELSKQEGYSSEQLCQLIINTFDQYACPNIKKPTSLEPILLNMSAFLTASEFMNSPANDVWNFPQDYDKRPIQESIKGFVAVTNINPIQLVEEAKTLLKEIDNNKDTEFYNAIFKHTCNVDITPNWDYAKELDLDIKLLNQAMVFPVLWVQNISAYLLYSKATQEELLELVDQNFQKEKGRALWFSSQLISENKPKGIELIINRLKSKHSRGSEHLYKVLYEQVETLSDDLILILEKGLYSTDCIAIEAAKLADKLLIPHERKLQKLIQDSYIYWLKNEKPYPENGGTIPESPRDVLLPSLLKFYNPHMLEFFEYANDKRSDINKIGQKLIFERLQSDNSFRDSFLNAISTQKLSATLLRKAITEKVNFSENQLEIITTLLKHEKAPLRLAAIHVLNEKHLTIDEIEKWLTLLSLDKEQEIRNKAQEISFLLKDKAQLS
jgi:hypothetical protein